MKHDVRIHFDQVDVRDLASLIARALPHQGAIEVQRDVAGKEHFWHDHDTDETLVLLDGQLRFYWDQGERVCAPGDMISVPAGTQHGSEALEPGATYLVACHRLPL